MATAFMLILAMVIAAPILGYVFAMTWAAEKGLVRKEDTSGEYIAMILH